MADANSGKMRASSPLAPRRLSKRRDSQVISMVLQSGLSANFVGEAQPTKQLTEQPAMLSSSAAIRVLNRLVIHPSSAGKATWDLLILAFVLYTSIIVPLKVVRQGSKSRSTGSSPPPSSLWASLSPLVRARSLPDRYATRSISAKTSSLFRMASLRSTSGYRACLGFIFLAALGFPSFSGLVSSATMPERGCYWIYLPPSRLTLWFQSCVPSRSSRRFAS